MGRGGDAFKHDRAADKAARGGLRVIVGMENTMVLQRAFPAGALGPVSDTPVLTCCIYLLLGSPPGAQGTGVSVVQQAGMQSHVQEVMLRAPAGGDTRSPRGLVCTFLK